MKRRAMFSCVIVVAFPSKHGLAQSNEFVGVWKEWSPGLGEIRLVITSVQPDGQIQGKFEFPGQAQVQTFSDKPNREKQTAFGKVSGQSLVIDTATGGRYELKLQGGRLVGTYNKAGFSTTFNFKKS